MDPVSRLNARLRMEQINAETSPRVKAWRERRSQKPMARWWRRYGGLVGWVGAPLVGAGIWWLAVWAAKAWEWF